MRIPTVKIVIGGRSKIVNADDPRAVKPVRKPRKKAAT